MKLLASFVIFSVLAMGVSYVSAEVEVPFTPESEECKLFENPTTLLYTCKWVADKDFGITVHQENLDEPDIEVLEKIAQQREDGTYVQPPIQGVIDQTRDPTDPRSTLDWVREKACKSDGEHDKELCNHLNQLSICEQGVTESESEPVSTYRKFMVSDGEISKTQNFDLQEKHFLRDIYLKIEECYAIWQVLQPTVLGSQYLDFIRQSDDLQPYHADMASVREQIRTHNPLHQTSFDHEVRQAEFTICNSPHYSQSTKDVYNCPKVKEWLVIPNPSGGVMPKSDEPLQKYLAYKNNPYSYSPDVPGKYVIIKSIEGEFAIKGTQK